MEKYGHGKKGIKEEGEKEKKDVNHNY